MNYKIIIWGLGGVYNKHLNVIKYFESTQSIEVIALTANNLPDISILDGYRVVPVTMIQSLDYDYIMIMNDVHFTDIVKTALENGVLRERILTVRILEIPNLNFNEYIRLKKSRLSIISNNCWGGIVYNNLGMECLSPFKNLFVEDDDYIRLLTNLKGYLEERIRFSHYAIDEHSKKEYPVMMIGDIAIHCNHDDNPETAARNWEKRCEKLNYNNLFIEMYTENPEIADQFQAMERYEKKICFVPFESGNENAFRLELHGRQTEFWEAVNSNAGNGNNCFTYDMIGLLNMERRYRGMR